MANRKLQPKASSSVSVAMPMQEILDAVCPDCRKALSTILASKLHTALIEGALDSQLKGKPDVS